MGIDTLEEGFDCHVEIEVIAFFPLQQLGFEYAELSKKPASLKAVITEILTREVRRQRRKLSRTGVGRA